MVIEKRINSINHRRVGEIITLQRLRTTMPTFKSAETEIDSKSAETANTN